jgi:hypothetical protein
MRFVAVAFVLLSSCASVSSSRRIEFRHNEELGVMCVEDAQCKPSARGLACMTEEVCMTEAEFARALDRSGSVEQ